MEAARPRRRRRRLSRNGAGTALDARLVRVGFLVVAPAVAALLVAVSSPGPLPRSPLEPAFDGQAARDLAETLATEYPSRIPGTAEAAGATRWYRETMSSLAIPTTEHAWTEDVPDLGRVTLRNVVSVIPGRSQDAIVLVAHRDNAGVSRPASDDASGTAALVELARGFAPQELSPAPELQHTLVLVSTDGGAYGGAGAEHFATTSPVAKSVVAAVVLDDLGRPGRPRLAVAGDDASSPSRTLVRTIMARVEEQSGDAPLLSGLTTQLVDLGLPLAESEQGRLLGHGIAAVALTTSAAGVHETPGSSAVSDPRHLEQLGRATEALVDSLDASAGGSLGTHDALFLGTRVVSGWAVRLTLILLVVPISLGVVDLWARSRRRGVRLAPAFRALRTRLFIWLLAGLLLAVGALVGVFPTGADLPLPPFASLVAHPPVAALAVLSGVFVLAWLAGRRRLMPVRASSPDERLGGSVAAMLALCALGVALAIVKPYALVFVLPALYAWAWIPTERVVWSGLALFLVGLAGPVLGLAILAQQLGLSLTQAMLYATGLATVGYLSVGFVLAAVVWAAVAGQMGTIAVGRYAPYAGGSEPPPAGVVRRSLRRVLRPVSR